MKVLILYRSRYGSTKDYATWLHEELPGSDIFNLDEFNADKLSEYDIVVIGSRTFVGNITGKDFLNENWGILNSKKIVFFTVGLVSQDDPASIRSYESISDNIRESLIFLKLPGRIKYSQLKLWEKIIARAQGLKEADNVNRELIKPLAEKVKEWEEDDSR